jgi:hypothetical protein
MEVIEVPTIGAAISMLGFSGPTDSYSRSAQMRAG